jgi:hypothetical protein
MRKEKYATFALDSSFLQGYDFMVEFEVWWCQDVGKMVEICLVFAADFWEEAEQAIENRWAKAQVLIIGGKVLWYIEI